MDFAVHDGNSSTDNNSSKDNSGTVALQLLCTGTTLAPASVAVPLIVVASYLFDSLPCDMYKVVACGASGDTKATDTVAGATGSTAGAAACRPSATKRRRVAAATPRAVVASNQQQAHAASDPKAADAGATGTAAAPHAQQGWAYSATHARGSLCTKNPAVALEARVTTHARRKLITRVVGSGTRPPPTTTVTTTATTPVAVDRMLFSFPGAARTPPPRTTAACVEWLRRHMVPAGDHSPAHGQLPRPSGLVLVPTAGLELLASLRGLQTSAAVPFVLLLADKMTAIGDAAFGPRPHVNPVVRGGGLGEHYCSATAAQQCRMHATTTTDVAAV